MDHRSPAARGERGIALVIAMLALLTVTMIVIVLMSSVNVETKLSSYGLREAKARNNAEAGVSEAVARIRNGDIPDTGTPTSVAQIFATNPGQVPTVTGDTLAMATGQPSGQWLDYSTAGKGPDVLTANYLLDPNGAIYRYDKTLTPPVNTTTGSPIWVITSTGHAGNVTRRIQAQVFADPIVLSTNAAVSTNVDVKLNGSGVVCGYDHASNTPNGTGANGRNNPPTDPINCVPYETGIQNLPGVRCTGAVTTNPPNESSGVPSAIMQNQPGFYTGPWDVVGKTESQFFRWIGPATSATPNPANGLIYLDNDGIYQNKSGAFAYQAGSGEGFLYVDGDLSINSSFFYRGIIYVEGNITINGNAWILGSVIVNGSTDGKFNGGMTVLYSSSAIQDALRKAGGQYINLAWREVP